MKSIAYIFTALLLATKITAQELGTPPAGRPIIVVILVDDMAYSSLGSFGGEIETPNLDAIATSGMRFSQFCNCAKCVSSRISIMSGQCEGRAGGKAFKNSVTMGEALQPAGYRTSAVGICRIWNADLGELITTLQGHTGRIRDVRFSPDESRIVSWATDDQIIVWDTAKPVANLLISWRGPSRPLQAR